ncbi:uncharacterized protein MELLADRAFT_66513 [Melampsora larici-populina 98AG31]|uniref:Uncharacterized protein n=1 Tax=Melampsora larici-populina (strain 98AG31 / pathotype 3-4-7) TaxID=747676 RepID=F4RZI2_MELLP|nr:uncharacterized protein MELLADRAFT_66513 [Melampsora larici-populina 98AG31]EGG02231.1 hypothetical protein MELLADRAFT_66513 [Melampsora larici-populina 98AG31]
MANSPPLPIEVVELILSYYLANSSQPVINSRNSVDSPSIEPSLLLELLNFRFIARSWSLAVLPHAYQNIRFAPPSIIPSFVDSWKLSATVSTGASIRRLAFEKVVSPDLCSSVACEWFGISINQMNRANFDRAHPRNRRILIDDVKRVLDLCSLTLTHLKLQFLSAVSFPPKFISTIAGTVNLQVLILTGNPYGHQIDHTESIRDLLNSTSRLSSLSLRVSFLRPLNLDQTSLPHLEHLSVTCNRNNSAALKQLCERQGRGIKHLEAFVHADRDAIIPIVLALRSSLESLAIESIPGHLPFAIRTENFPKLKVIRTVDTLHTRRGLSWLQFGICHNMETFVTSYYHSADHWRKGLEALEGRLLNKPATFKKIVFVKTNSDIVDSEAASLSDLLKYHGIHCDFTSRWNYADLTNLTTVPLAQTTASEVPPPVPEIDCRQLPSLSKHPAFGDRITLTIATMRLPPSLPTLHIQFKLPICLATVEISIKFQCTIIFKNISSSSLFTVRQYRMSVTNLHFGKAFSLCDLIPKVQFFSALPVLFLAYGLGKSDSLLFQNP